MSTDIIFNLQQALDAGVTTRKARNGSEKAALCASEFGNQDYADWLNKEELYLSFPAVGARMFSRNHEARTEVVDQGDLNRYGNAAMINTKCGFEIIYKFLDYYHIPWEVV